MKKTTLFITMALIIIGLSGIFLIVDSSNEATTETNTQNSVENIDNDLDKPSIEIEDTENFKDEEEHDDHEHEHSVEIEGSEVKQLTVQQVADLWEIDSEELLNRIIQEFDFKGDYTTETVLEDMREEYKFSPAIIKDIAEEIKQK